MAKLAKCCDINPEILVWARDRVRYHSVESLRDRFPDLAKWEAGEEKPKLVDLERYAKAVYLPLGYFFFSECPKEELPENLSLLEAQAGYADANFWDTLYICQRGQDWYQGYAEDKGCGKLGFIGSLEGKDMGADLERVLGDMGGKMGVVCNFKGVSEKKLEKLFNYLIMRADRLGILVMINGVVGSNTKRKLDQRYFYGFVLVDELAPVIFINDGASIRDKLFTLACGLVCLWKGERGKVLRGRQTRAVPSLSERLALYLYYSFGSFF